MMLPFTRKEGDIIIHSSPWPSDEQDYFRGNIAECILNSPALSKYPNQKIFIDGRDSSKFLTATDVKTYTRKIAYVLKHSYGIGDMDVVCLFTPNLIYVPVIMYGVLATGGLVSPANIAYLPRELHHQLHVSQAKLILTTEELYPVAKAALTAVPESPLLGTKLVIIDDLIKQVQKSTGLLEPFKLKKGEEKSRHAVYCFSSGTSGLPKGVVSTHYNLISNMHQQLSVNHMYIRENVFGCILPMSHIFALSKYCITMPYIGASMVLFPKFDFELMLQKITEYKISVIHIVPPIAVLLAKHPLVEKYPKVSENLKFLLSGAAPLSKTLAEAVKVRMNCVVSQGYGLTETSPQSHAFSWNEEVYDISGIGWLVPNMDARLVDENGKDVEKPNTPGEIYMRGPNVFGQYLRDPKSTAASFDGTWFKTGDVAEVDEHGGWKIVDRVKELIKSHGFQVAPAELEGVLLCHPCVADAAVTGVHVEDKGTEYPRAYVVLVNNAQPLEVLSWFNDRVARHKRLYGGIVVVKEIPKSPSGKILRRILRASVPEKVYGYPPVSAKL